MSFLGEIKRRKVFQVAAVYAVVAWIVIQIVDVVGEPLSLPMWFDTVVIVLLAIGFPIAVILAWAFDVTPEGIRAASDTSVPTGQISGSRFAYATQTLVLLAVGFLVVDQYLLKPRSGTGDRTQAGVEVSAPVRRLEIPLGRAEPVRQPGILAILAISSGAERLAYTIQKDGYAPIFVRELDELTATEIPGTDGASNLPMGAPCHESGSNGDQQLGPFEVVGAGKTLPGESAPAAEAEEARDAAP